MTLKFNAKKVKAKRESKGMTQEDLARAADVTVSTIVQLEGGHKEPRVNTLARVAQVLTTKLDYFFDAA